MKTRELKIQMTDFHRLYRDLSKQMSGNQKKIPIDSCVEVFFGYSFTGNLRLSFMSKSVPPTIESTKVLHVVQGCEDKSTYWTSFDLLDANIVEAYLSFCENLIDSITGIKVESEAMNMLKRRFITWKILFQKMAPKDLTKEVLMGAFGELAVLKDVIAPRYGIKAAVQAWGGADRQSKDFTVGNTWYEVKTVGANTDTVRISSLAQLSSKYDGHLAVVKVESVSQEFQGKCSAIIDLVKEVLLMITDDNTEDLLVKKIQSIGIDVFGSEITDRFDIKSLTVYKVEKGFPKITPENIPYSEITDVKYSISLASIKRFAEE